MTPRTAVFVEGYATRRWARRRAEPGGAEAEPAVDRMVCHTWRRIVEKIGSEGAGMRPSGVGVAAGVPRWVAATGARRSADLPTPFIPRMQCEDQCSITITGRKNGSVRVQPITLHRRTGKLSHRKETVALVRASKDKPLCDSITGDRLRGGRVTWSASCRRDLVLAGAGRDLGDPYRVEPWTQCGQEARRK